MIKKTLSILALSGLLLLPLSHCAKSDELGDAEVNEIFNVLFLALNEALGEANASATVTARPVAGNRTTGDIIYTILWQGSGEFEGISFNGSVSVNTDSGYYAGDYLFTIILYDASPSLKQTVIINSAMGMTLFSGNAYKQTFLSNNEADFEMIIGTKKYSGAYDYDLDAVGSAVTYKGTVVINGKSYNLSY